MILYHMSETLQLGDEVKLDYKEYSDLAEPFRVIILCKQKCRN